ncbi:MAG: DsbA family protein [Burkholderiaceae bacterium]|nr:DsbA family protein [Burkholderiaceae bacterium]
MKPALPAIDPAREAGAAVPPGPLDFYFDFISPYGYFALAQIEAVAARHQRVLRWRPFHMRAVTREVLGMTQAMGDVPLKGPYVRQDVRRTARWLGLPYAPAPTAGFSSVVASRFLCVVQDKHPQSAAAFARAVFHSHHALGRSPNTWDDCQGLAAQIGVPLDALNEAACAEPGRELFRAATAAAVAQGVWGTPTFVVDGEMFWGSDRIAQVDAWLEQGGW